MEKFEIQNRMRERLHKAVKGTLKVVVDTTQLRQILMAVNMSQRELAERAGVNHVTVNYIVNERHTPRLDTMDKITRALVRVLNEAYGGNLSRVQLLQLLDANTSEYRKGRLWGVLANDKK